MPVKRALIWLFTFGFGLIWVLAFLLPTEVGGGIDRHGMYAPDLVGSRLFYTTGVRATPRALSEHTKGAEIVMMDLNRTAQRERTFGFSPFRRDDYFGAKRPQIVQTDAGFKALYIGLGYDDRRRICIADSPDGTRWTPRVRAVFDAPPEAGRDGPGSFTVSRAAGGYRLYYVGSSRAKGVVFSAFSSDLESWSDEGLFLELPGAESVLSFDVLPDGRALLVSRIGDDPPFVSAGTVTDGSLRDRTWLGGRRDPGLPVRGPALFSPPFADEIVDARVVGDGSLLRVLIVGGSRRGDSRLRIALYEGPSLAGLRPADGSQPDGSVAQLSAPATSTVFHELAGAAAQFVPVVMTFGFGMGLISLLGIHGRRLVRGGENAFFSILVAASMLAMVVVQFGYRLTKPQQSLWSQLNDLLFMRMQFPLGATMFGLLAAYLVSAAYRAFRIRSFDAVVLTLMAALIVLTQVPTAQFIASLIVPGAVEAASEVDAAASHARNWALMIANDAVQRAVGFGAFVGAIAMAMRVWLSLDKTAAE